MKESYNKGDSDSLWALSLAVGIAGCRSRRGLVSGCSYEPPVPSHVSGSRRYDAENEKGAAVPGTATPLGM